MVKKIIYILFVLLLLSGCNKSCSDGGDDDQFVLPDSLLYKTKEIDPTVIEGFIEGMSNPVEMAALIKSLDVQYSSKHLASTDNIEKFTTQAQQAFNLGIFGTDLGYLNMYNKTNIVLDYIGAIKTLSDGINVGQFFDFTTLKRLAQNNQNLDSLMYISVHSFNEMDRYLREDNRSNLSVLIITGVWLEGMYLATQVYKEMPHPELKERIGEQKIVIDELMLFIKNFKQNRFFNVLITELDVLHKEFADVSITVQKGEPEMIEEDGMLVIVQNDISTIEISDTRVENIIKLTEQIRNKLISN